MTTTDDAALSVPGPLGVSLDDLGEALGAAATVLRANAMAAGLDAPVPTCPEWTVLDLVVHQGMVHRWAASHLRGAPAEPEPLEREGRESADVLGWFDDGATALLQSIVDAPDDLDAAVFLREAPAPRLFWTRRQCHETTVHAVDALGARLGRPARADETWIRPAVALDGIDELLVGFVTRRREGASPGAPTRLLVRPDDADVAWLVDLDTGRPVRTRRVRPVSAESPESAESVADHTLGGDPVDLYLRLWSRGAAAPVDELERWWRETISISW
ncbi:maleylpyruvate isomerase N-terminal domain-containing protein [Terrabacter sp. LjRoot27]|uniref:maleylpyruvate isomerase N-terminal domain-containing protein n=1 Tax=Terrabacter sp. LjRoot27 TaxID=3342306 RepID=UPI003ECCA22B